MTKFQKHDDILELLLQKHPQLDLSCGGRGQCGKCRLQVTKGFLPVTDAEGKLLSKVQLAQGIRLACEHRNCEAAIEGELLHEQRDMQIVGVEELHLAGHHEEGCVLAVDIGTTTVVLVLLDLQTGNVLLEKSFLNPQRRYGSDVISRIQHAHEKGPTLLQELLLKGLRAQLKAVENKDIRRMCICGNAVMTHLFLGIDPIPLAAAPYECVQKELVICSSKQFFPDFIPEFEIQVLPPISAYVGSDILMGIYAQDMEKNKQSSLLLDLGTNGELALYHEGMLIVSSAACGPAFEGGNMSCGCGAVTGAVSEVRWENGFRLQTIHDGKPVGICGSGYLSLISCLLTASLLDVSGYLNQQVTLFDGLLLTQKDVREFQLAKAAIAAALERVCAGAQCSYEQIEAVYLAGGFGRHLHVEDLCITGILPTALKQAVRISGNTALKGCCRYALEQNRTRMELLCKKGHCILLASDTGFSDAFISHMLLEPFT